MACTVLATSPIQIGKFVVTVVPLRFGVLGYWRIIPAQQLTALLVVPFVGSLLAVVIIAETLVTGFRMIRDERSVLDRLSAERACTAIRALEATVVFSLTASIVGLILRLPDEPMARPGVIGLLFIFTALGGLIPVENLLRTTEHHVQRRRNEAEWGTTSTRSHHSCPHPNPYI